MSNLGSCPSTHYSIGNARPIPRSSSPTQPASLHNKADGIFKTEPTSRDLQSARKKERARSVDAMQPILLQTVIPYMRPLVRFKCNRTDQPEINRTMGVFQSYQDALLQLRVLVRSCARTIPRSDPSRWVNSINNPPHPPQSRNHPSQPLHNCLDTTGSFASTLEESK